MGRGLRLCPDIAPAGAVMAVLHGNGVSPGPSSAPPGGRAPLAGSVYVAVSTGCSAGSHHDRHRIFHRSSFQSVFLARPTASITHPNGTAKKTISDENSIGK